MTFRLPNFLHSGLLNALRAEMGAPLTATYKVENKYVPIELPLEELLKRSGIDVTFDEIKPLDDGTLSYKGYRVLLYIRDVANYGDRQKLPKYHLSYCNTLQRMKHDNRFERYVVANRDDGMFQVNLMQEGERARLLPLNVCQFCLTEIAWQGFRGLVSRGDRANAVKRFSLAEFFKAYPRDLMSVLPAHSSDTAPLNEYTEDWPVVSETAKSKAEYRCQKCTKSLTLRHGKYLHVHHKNGVKYDNRDANLEVLCIGCHADEPLHSHMKSLPEYLAFKQLFG